MPSEVPSGWNREPLGGIASESRARFDPLQESKVLPYVGLEHIQPGLSVVCDFGSTSNVTSQKTLFRPGDILFGKLRPYLRKVASIDREGVCSTDILAIRPKSGTDAGFLLNVLSRDETIQWATARSAGTKMPRTSWKALAELDVLVPPLPEQKKIADILSSVDEAIQATQAVIEQTRRVKEGLLQDLLTRGIGHTRFKQTGIGEIPEGWEVARVGRALSIENNRRKPISREIRAAMPGPYPYWGPTRIQDHIDEYAFDGDYALVGEDGDHFLKWEHSEMTMWATGRFNVNNHAHALSSTAKCRARWFFYYFMHSDLRHVLTRQGAGRYKLTKAALENLRIAVPPISEQDTIIQIMDACRESPVEAEATLEVFKHLKSGLLQDLLTGKVRVSV